MTHRNHGMIHPNPNSNAKNKKEFQTDISELPIIIHDNNVRLFDKTVYNNYDIINSILESNQTTNSFYIVDLGEVITKYQQWRDLLPMVKPYYATKCNPNPVILRLLSVLGSGFDCASKNEIALVNEYNKQRNGRSVSAQKNNILYANPCKDGSQIQYARANNVDMMTFDSENELYKIKLFHPYAKLIIRIKADDSKSVCKFNCKFGVDLDEAETLLALAKTLGLNIAGVSFHVGSGCASPEPYRFAIKDAKRVFLKAREFGMDMSILDIGGGFPGVDTDKITFAAIAEVVRDELEKSFGEYAWSSFPRDFPERDDIKRPILDIISEPGRHIVASAYTLVINVIGKKTVMQNGKKSFVYHMNNGVYSSFNCILYDHATPTILPFNACGGECYDTVIQGESCDSFDVISRDCQLPELAIGDCCFVENFGAYTAAASSTFNGLGEVGYVYVLKY